MAFTKDSTQALQAFLKAEDIAARQKQVVSSLHLLLALLVVPTHAKILLEERGITKERLRAVPLDAEPPRTVTRLRDHAREIAQGTGQSTANCLHMLISITRARESLAYRALEQAGVVFSELRTAALSHAFNRS